MGMQCAVIEFARNVLNWKDANSTEFDPGTQYPVISLLEEQQGLEQKGGTMRLGAYPCVVAKDTLAFKEYQKEYIRERHRHRFEFSLRYRPELEAQGMRFTGLSPDAQLVEIIELKSHPWFIGVQFHPEFQSKPTNSHPLFQGFIATASKLL